MTYLEQFEALCLRNAERAAAICRIEAEDREDGRLIEQFRASLGDER